MKAGKFLEQYKKIFGVHIQLVLPLQLRIPLRFEQASYDRQERPVDIEEIF
jgi:hypothetical protein